jgi:hypothetical protein
MHGRDFTNIFVSVPLPADVEDDALVEKTAVCAVIRRLYRGGAVARSFSDFWCSTEELSERTKY